MKYIDTIEINRSDFYRINKLFKIDFDDVGKEDDLSPTMEELINETDARPDTMPYAFGFNFENGSHIYIDICSGSSNYYDNCQWLSNDYSQNYLFDCGYELYEENEFNYNGDTYICKFIIKEDK